MLPRAALLALLALFALQLPQLALAASSAGINGKDQCSNGITEQVNQSESFTLALIGGSDPATVKSFLNKIENCVSACYDESINVVTSTGLASVTFKVTSSGSNMCSKGDSEAEAVKEKRGCDQGQAQPKETIATAASDVLKASTHDVSRCDAAASKEVSNLIDKKYGSDTSSIQQAFDALSQYKAPASVSGPSNDQQALSTVLSAYMTTDEAQKIASDPNNDASAILKTLQSGTAQEKQEAVQAAASNAGVTLNDSVLKDISTLSPPSQPPSDTPTDAPQASGAGNVPAPDSTFNQGQNQPTDLKSQDPSKLSSYDMIRRVANDACQAQGCDGTQLGNSMIAVHTVECGTKDNCGSANATYAGFFQMGKSEFQAGLAAGMPMIQQSDPALYAQAQADLQNSSNPRSDPLLNTIASLGTHSQNEVAIEQATTDPTRQAAIHQMIQFMPYQTQQALSSGDPSQVFSMQLNSGALSALASNKVNLGYGATGADAISGIASNLPNLQRGVSIAQTGSAGSAVQPAASASPFGGLFGSSYAGYQSVSYGYDAPLSSYGLNASPFSFGYSPAISAPLSSSYQQSYPATYPSAGAVQPQQASATQAAAPAPVASLIVNPLQASIGQPVVASFSSAAVSPAAPCFLTVNGKLVAQGNGGSYSTSSPVAASLSFAFQCAGANGQIVTKSAAATVH